MGTKLLVAACLVAGNLIWWTYIQDDWEEFWHVSFVQAWAIGTLAVVEALYAT